MLPTFDIPSVGPRQGKIWGDTQLVFAHNGIESHRIRYKVGYRSSRHKHHVKWNRFVVLSGRLSIVIFHPQEFPSAEELKDETIITAGQITDIPPGVWHQFEILEAGEALEFYWTVLEAGDIERADIGGKMA